MSQDLDFFNVMAYDYHGAWENTTNHNAPLYGNPNDPSSVASQYNIDSTIQNYLSAGVPANKIVMGAPAYLTIIDRKNRLETKLSNLSLKYY